MFIFINVFCIIILYKEMEKKKQDPVLEPVSEPVSEEPVWNRTGTGYIGSSIFRLEPGKTRPGSHKNRFLMTSRGPEPVFYSILCISSLL